MLKAEWHALSARLGALLDAATYYYDAGRDGYPDHVGADKFLARAAKSAFEDICALERDFGPTVPTRARTCLTAFLSEFRTGVAQDGRQGPRSMITALATFRAEFTYLLSDAQTVARNLVKRAFVHLQRSIVADDQLRDKWLKAFNDGETACEKLGAVHMLSHGIWAFKASADGGRTDLVLGGALAITDELRTSSEALVLTEWKLVRSPAELDNKLTQALAQARRYASDTLAGFELSSRRYLVVVSLMEHRMPPEHIESEATYEYVGIPLHRAVPSRTKT